MKKSFGVIVNLKLNYFRGLIFVMKCQVGSHIFI